MMSQDEQESSLVPRQGIRITGAVDLIIDGRTDPKSPTEVLGIARKTRFNEAGAYECKYEAESCTVTYVPAEGFAGASRLAVAEGLLLYKIIVRGTPPKQINLDEGTYYFFIQYVNGRWLGIAVDERAKARCATVGLLVREVYSVHPDLEHRTDSHVLAHRIVSPEEHAKLGVPLLAAAQGWVDVQIGWEPFGAGCWKQIVCVPAT